MSRARFLALVVTLCCGLSAWAQRDAAAEAVADQLSQARAQKQAGQLQAAEKLLGEVLDQAPSSAEAWWLLGWVRHGLNRSPEAAQAFAKAATLLPEGDPRRVDAQRWHRRLTALSEPPARWQPVEPVAPVAAAWSLTWLNGWPLALVGLLAAICLGATVVALRSDARLANESAAARYARLCLHLGDGNRQQVAELLKLIEHPDLIYLPVEDAAYVLRFAATERPELRDALAPVVAGGTGRARQAAAIALAGLADQPDPGTWTPFLTGDDAALRRAALHALSRTAEPGARAALADLARRAPAAEAVPAVQALGRIANDSAAEALLAACATHRSPDVRRVAAEQLAHRTALPARLAPRLAELVAQPDAPGRASLVAALGRVMPPAVEPLLRCLLDDEPTVRQAAQRVLRQPDGRVSGGPGPAALLTERLLAQPEAATREALDVLSAWAADDAPPVLAAVAAAAAPLAVRRAALEYLATSPSAAAATALQGLFGHLDEPPELRLLYAETMAQRGPDSALDQWLHRAAMRPDDCLAGETARQLAERPGGTERLLSAAIHGTSAVRRLARRLLPAQEQAIACPDLVAAIEQWRGDGERSEAAELIAAAGRLRLIDGREAVGRLLAACPDLAGDATDVALARLGDESARARVEAMLIRGDWAARRPAAEYYRGQPDLSARAAAVVAEADAHEAAEQLVALVAPEALPARLAALGDAVKPTLDAWLMTGPHRRAAAAALERLGARRAPALAEALDRADQLLATPGDESSRRALAALVAAEGERLRQYVAERLGEPL